MGKRLKYIDLARGFTMLTILWGHVMLSGKTNILVYAFHIPVYFFLSGLVFKSEKYPTLWSFIKRRIITLLIPYLIFSALTWAFWLLDAYTKGQSLVNWWRPLAETFIARGSAGYMIHNPALWFVTCLFVVEILYYFICKLPLYLNIFFCGVAAGIASALMGLGITYLPWNVEVALSAVIFYSLGNILGKMPLYKKTVEYGIQKPFISFAVSVLFFAVMCVGALWNGHVSMAQCQLGERSTVVFYAVAVFGIAFVLFGCVFLEGCYGRYKPIDRILDYFIWIGRNSFYFMVLHIPCMLVCVRIVAKFAGLGYNDVRNDYIYTVPAWIGMMIGSTILTLLVNFIKKKIKRH